MSGGEPHHRATWRLDLVEGAAIVLGYGLAALLFRAFWPTTGVSRSVAVFAIGLYAWMGMAMSGPLLLIRPVPASVGGGDSQPSSPGSSRARSWAEIAWQVIGVYWIVLGVFVLPIRLHSFRFGDTVLFGTIPLGAGIIMRLFGPPAQPAAGSSMPWTHHAAVALIVTWPLAWLCLIVLGEAIF